MLGQRWSNIDSPVWAEQECYNPLGWSNHLSFGGQLGTAYTRYSGQLGRHYLQLSIIADAPGSVR